MGSKRILVFCDGTGADANAITIPTGVGFAIGEYATNVIRLARAVKPTSADGLQQLVFYQSGVGSVTDFNASTVFGTTTTQATGLGVATKIREAYAFIAQNFQTSDEICLFGFSRGAYTARKIASLIDKISLLHTSDLGSFFDYWAKLVKGQTFTKPGRDTKIKCVGVWDTVGSILNVTDALHIKDDEIPASVVTALQALSLQDNRASFWPTLWVPPASGLAPGQTLTQVWFPGAHCDVGGGYKGHAVSDLPLFWMADKLTYPSVIVEIDLDFIWKCRQKTSDGWGTTQPHNAWKGTPAGWPKTRLDLCESDAFYHQSINSAPTKLDSSFCMITLDDLTQKFSTEQSTWKPTCPDLGPFETTCQTNWDTSNDAEVTFENPLDLFNPVIWVKNDMVIPSTELIENGMQGSIPMCVARVSYKDGIHPGKCVPTYQHAWWGWGGKEYDIEDDYEILIGPEKYVRWVAVDNEFSLSKLSGATPVIGGNESDGTLLYIARYEGQGGKVSVDHKATYSYGGEEITTDYYDVLVYNDLPEWSTIMDRYITDNESPEQENEQTYYVQPGLQSQYVPQVALGITMIDMSLSYNLRVITFANNISTHGQNVFINAWSDTVLYNAGVSWMMLASNDPEYQSGSWSINCDASNYDATGKTRVDRTLSQRVNFPVGFASQPKVFVGISGFDLKGDWYLAISATDIDSYGFTVHVITAANTILYGIKVDYIAYLPMGKTNIWNGTYIYGGSTHVDFGIRFLNTPKIFGALTQFDVSNGYNLRIVANWSNVALDGMDVSLTQWSDTEIRSATAAYIAIDEVVGA